MITFDATPQMSALQVARVAIALPCALDDTVTLTWRGQRLVVSHPFAHTLDEGMLAARLALVDLPVAKLVTTPASVPIWWGRKP